MKILSLFDGISVAQQALKNCGIKVDEYYASEIDKYAIQITQKNFPNTIQLGDVCVVKKEMVGDIDLLIGGSPCQDLSIAKKNREGLLGSRSGLFWEYVRILKEVKPKYFILENVNSMPKEAKELITQTLGVEPIMINAALVSAQNRKRLFWVGKLVGDKYETVKIEQPEDRGILLRDILEKDVDEKYITKMDFTNRFDYTLHKEPFEKKGQALRATDFKGTHNMVVNNNGDEKLKSNTLRTSGRGSGLGDKHNWDTIRIGQIGKGGQGDRIYSPEGKSVNLSANGGGRKAKTGLYAVASRTYPRIPNGEKRNKQIELRKDKKSNSLTSVQGDSMVLINSKGKTHQQDLLQNTEGKCRTIPAGTHGSTPHLLKTIMPNQIIRKLTPIECERLQSLPDNFTSGVSNTQRYKALGNAFNCEVIKHILKTFIL